MAMSENNLEGLLQRGKLELDNEQYETALATFEQADSLFPDNPGIKYVLSFAFYGLEQYETALECLNQALKIAPDFQIVIEAREELLRELREKAYLKLIVALIQCENGREEEILTENEHLIDSDLIETIKQVATYYEQEGNNNTSGWLQNLGQILTRYLEEAEPTQAHYEFLFEILQTIERGSEREQVYSLLRKNLDKLDLKLANALQNWANNTLLLIEELEARESLGYLVGNFCLFIQDFSLGNQADNLEIAITGYNTLLNIFTKADSPQDWASIQNNLGNAYSDRIKGERAENIEAAITAFQQALTIYTQQHFPQDWALMQFNLGGRYSTRIKGDGKENLEQAIQYCQNALTIINKHSDPIVWAQIQHNLAFIYRRRIKGNKGKNIDKAITLYENVLTIHTKEDFPLYWAMTQMNLGVAYVNRIIGIHTDNIREAIKSYEML